MPTSTPPSAAALFSAASPPRASFPVQLAASTRRALQVNLRVPFVLAIPFVISLFFLVVYEGQLGPAAAAFMPGGDYLGFTVPLALLSAAFAGGGLAGQTVVRDLESGYFDRLLLTPASRWALVLGPVLAGGVVLLGVAVLLLGVAAAMGLGVAARLPGVLALLGLDLAVGLAFAGLPLGVALRTADASAVEGSALTWFPLSYLTASFVPPELLSGWLGAVAAVNPVTYVLGAMRSLIATGWDGSVLAAAAAACAVLVGLSGAFVAASLRARLRSI